MKGPHCLYKGQWGGLLNMAALHPFKALRPAVGEEKSVACMPYDVVSGGEARAICEETPYSFMSVIRSEATLDKGVDEYSDAVYARAYENLTNLEKEHHLVRDEKPCFYVYAETLDSRTQTGIVGCASVEDYVNNVIKKHEFTRAEKEADRIRHISTTRANTGLVFLTHKRNDALKAIIEKTTSAKAPVCDFTNALNVRQQVWVVDNDEDIAAITEIYATIPALYIADGHHRAASSVKAAIALNTEESKHFMCAVFAEDELLVMPYNRVITDKNSLTGDELLMALEHDFEVSPIEGRPCDPTQKGEFNVYVESKWYKLKLYDGRRTGENASQNTDAAVLQRVALAPILGILEPTKDKRISFIGGGNTAEALENAAGAEGVAFMLCPVTVGEVMDVADEDGVMPPKSTWFEPKLMSGLFVHTLD
ncbi:MAG: DUF1015 domain-containing protein [Clostridiales bacterium]|nr:DUF1015 domain-containing protein [Clostridiales bacterium]